MSPDWADKPEAGLYSDLDNPQSLNLYGYVNNNPLSKADPDGHCCVEEQEAVDETSMAVAQEFGPAAGGAAKLIGEIGIGGGLLYNALHDKISDIISPSTTVGQSDAAEIAQRNANLGGTQEHKEASPEPQTSTSGAGAMKGGGRNGQKVNADRVQSARENNLGLKGQRDALASKANKTPADKKELKKLDNQIKQQQSRMKPSENHSQKGKGQQQ